MGFLDRLLGRTSVPAGSTGALEAGEEPLAVATVRTGHLVVTRVGLWVPGDEAPQRLDWHLVSRAGWDGENLELTVAEEIGTAGEAVLLADVAVRAYAVTEPGDVPSQVNARVTGSVRSAHHRVLPGGGAWFVQRAVPGRDGVVLQVRLEPGTDHEVASAVAAEVAAALPRR